MNKTEKLLQQAAERKSKTSHAKRPKLMIEMDHDQHAALKQFCESLGISRAKLIRSLIADFLDGYPPKGSE